jgi:2'-5' RNA ligase
MNWRREKGFEIHKYDLSINTIQPSKTRREQQAKIEKISLVAFLNKEQKKVFANICRRLKRNDKDFYQNSNLHATVFGFGPLKKKDYEIIQKKIQEFSRKERDRILTVNFDAVRRGTIYSENKTDRPVHGMSN